MGNHSHYIGSLAKMTLVGLFLNSMYTLQLFKRRNVDVLNEDETMLESPLADSYLNSPVTVSVSFLTYSSYTFETVYLYTEHSVLNRVL